MTTAVLAPTATEVGALIEQALRTLNEERSADEQIAIGADTVLFGEDSVLDSLALVSVIVDIETLASDQFGRAVSLTDDRAMARDPVPFVNVQSLRDYILELLAE
jgi:acyl carrier protein